MNDLMQKLAISKAIMDKHDSIGRNKNGVEPNLSISKPELENFDTPIANYNIPSEFLSESKVQKVDSAPITKDKILNSKLPDEIKRLMIENPIVQVNPMSPSSVNLSDEMIEKATKLMNVNKKGNVQESTIQKTTTSDFDLTQLKKVMKEVVKEVLKENGLILESTSKTNESMMIKVGQHIFEGKISTVKKLK